MGYDTGVHCGEESGHVRDAECYFRKTGQCGTSLASLRPTTAATPSLLVLLVLQLLLLSPSPLPLPLPLSLTLSLLLLLCLRSCSCSWPPSPPRARKCVLSGCEGRQGDQGGGPASQPGD
jgi:hypothetical protein